jgi:hypothetical protein
MDRLQRILDAIAASGLTHLHIDLRSCEGFSVSGALAAMLLSSLPVSLTHLALAIDLDKCPTALFRNRCVPADHTQTRRSLSFMLITPRPVSRCRSC